MSPQDWNLCSTSHEIFIHFPLPLCVSCRDFYRRLSLLGDLMAAVRKLCHSYVGGKHQLSIDSKNPCSIHCKPFIEHDKTKPQTSLTTPHLVNENEQLKKMKAKYCTTISERNLSHNKQKGKSVAVKLVDRRASCRETDVTRNACISVWREKIRRNSLSISTNIYRVFVIMWLICSPTFPQTRYSLSDDVTLGR